MNIKDLAPWIAIAITLILSILVPVFTQIVNNRFQLKTKEMEIRINKQNKKMDIYENFMNDVGGCVLSAHDGRLPKAGASIQKMYIYLPDEYWDCLDNLYCYIDNREWQKAREEMLNINKWIANDMKKN